MTIKCNYEFNMNKCIIIDTNKHNIDFCLDNKISFGLYDIKPCHTDTLWIHCDQDSKYGRMWQDDPYYAFIDNIFIEFLPDEYDHPRSDIAHRQYKEITHNEYDHNVNECPVMIIYDKDSYDHAIDNFNRSCENIEIFDWIAYG